jgi:hypothetical protein
VVNPTTQTVFGDEGDVFLFVNGIGQGNNRSAITEDTFHGGPLTFPTGTAITLSWNTYSNSYKAPGTFSACTATNGWTGAKAVSGSQALGALAAGTYNFTLKCRYTPKNTAITPAADVYTYVPVVIQAANTAVKPYWANGYPFLNKELPGFTEKIYTYDKTKCGTGSMNATCVAFDPLNLKKTSVVSEIYYDEAKLGQKIGINYTGYYSAKWSTQYIPLQSSAHTFVVTTVGGVRVYLDNVLKINDWVSHGQTVDTFTANLIAGKPYTLKIEYYSPNMSGTESIKYQVGLTPLITALGTHAYMLDVHGDADLVNGGY